MVASLPFDLTMQSLVSNKVEAVNNFVSCHYTCFNKVKIALIKTNAAMATQADVLDKTLYLSKGI